SNEQEADFNVPCRIRDRRTRIVETPSKVHLDRGLFIDIIPVDAFHAGGLSRLLDHAVKFTYRYCTKLRQPSRHSTAINHALGVLRQLLYWMPGVTPDSPARIFRRFVSKAFIDRTFNEE